MDGPTPMRPGGSMRAALAAVLLLSACSGGSPDVPDAGPFTQKDLEGSWRFANVYHDASVSDGGPPGWLRGTVEIDASGGLAFAGEDSAGRAVSGPGSSLHVDAEGFLTASDPATLAGRVNKARNFLVATATENGTPSIRFALKTVSGTTWSGADLASRRFSYHYLATGSDPSWEHGVASIDGNGALTLTERVAGAGPQPDLAAGTLTVAGEGIVTLSGDATWKGHLSADKSVLVATKTRDDPGHGYAVIVLTRLGQSYLQADLAGAYGFYRLVASRDGGGWASGRMTIDASGTATMTSFTTNTGPQPLPGVQVVTLQADGLIRNPSSATYHSVMGFNKDLTVRTETTGPGGSYAMLSVSVK